MSNEKPKGTYIYPRFDDKGRLYMEGRDFKLFLAGKKDEALGWDKYFYTSARSVLGNENGDRFIKEFDDILKYMAEINRIGEITKVFKPLLVLFHPEQNQK